MPIPPPTPNKNNGEMPPPSANKPPLKRRRMHVHPDAYGGSELDFIPFKCKKCEFLRSRLNLYEMMIDDLIRDIERSKRMEKKIEAVIRMEMQGLSKGRGGRSQGQF